MTIVFGESDVKLLIGLAGSGLLAGGLYATGALTPGTVYDKPFDEAYADLSSMPVTPLLGFDKAMPGPGAGQRVDQVSMTRTANSIGWRLTVGPTEIATFTAQLTPVGPSRTRVTVDFRPNGKGSEKSLESTVMITDLARIAMAEQIDARLENRQSNARAMFLAMGRHITANPDQLRDFGRAVEGAMGEVAVQLHGTDGDSNRPSRPHDLNDPTRPSAMLPAN